VADGAVVGELTILGFLERHGDRAGFAFVAQVAERGPVLGDPGCQSGKDLQIFTQSGGVVLAAWAHLGCPQRPAIGSGDDRYVPAVVGVLPRPPQVHSACLRWRSEIP
jgi:hypothetical protein